MKTLKHFLLLIVSTLLISTASSQCISFFRFEYDKAGNRTKRELRSFCGPKGRYAFYDTVPNADSIKPEPILLEDKVGKSEIKIYPNPTNDIINIEVTNGKYDSKGIIGIYDSEGRVIEEIKGLRTMNTLNIGSRAPGLYLLRIMSYGKKTEWKVLKE